MPTPSTPSPGVPTLLLVPTAGELEGLQASGASLVEGVQVHLCGFGPVNAGVRAAQLIGLLTPRRVVLAGIAGSYDLERLPLGSVARFERVALDGVGVGDGDAFQHASTLGFGDGCEPLELYGATGGGELLTVCSAARDGDTVSRRLARHPGARAEDMEGYAVALACSSSGTPLTVVRGISNEAGATPEHWNVPAALQALGPCLKRILEGSGPDRS